MKSNICHEVKYKTNKAGSVREINTKNVTAENNKTELSRNALDDLLVLLNEFKHVIAFNMRQLGITDKKEMKIEVKRRKGLLSNPKDNDHLDLLHDKKYFTSLDLRSGYYQIPVQQSSRGKTTFVTPDGTYQFLVLRDANLTLSLDK